MLGTKTIGAAYDKSKALTKECSLFILNLPQWILQKVQEIKDHIALMKSKMKNFYKTNLDLGLYHLHLGNFNDAIMRFKIIDRFISPKDSEANYWLGWCYFLKNNYAKALKYLENSNEKDTAQFVNFIKDCDTASEVPRQTWQVIKELATHSEIQKAGNYVINLPQDFVSELFDAMEELPKECSMLDLGCSGGFVGAVIDDKLQKNYHLTGTEDREEMLKNVKRLREDKRQVYDDLRHESIEEFLNTNKTQYHVITSFNSLTFSKDLEPYFKQIHAATKAGGYFAILLPQGDKTSWNPLRSEFIYHQDGVARQLKLAEFEIVSIKEWKLNRVTNYVAFICKK